MRSWGARGVGNTIWKLLRVGWGTPERDRVGGRAEMLYVEANEVSRDRDGLNLVRDEERAVRVVKTYCWVMTAGSSEWDPTDSGLD